MKRCVWCDGELTDWQVMGGLLLPLRTGVCIQCQHIFHKLSEESCCIGCGRRMEEVMLCYDCQRWQSMIGERFVSNRSLYQYDAMGKEWMERYKFIGDTRVVTMVIKDVRALLLPLLAQQYMICPLPSSKKSLIKREFETIEYLLTKAHLPYTQLLRHIGEGKKQSEKTRQERMELEQPFMIRDGVTKVPSKVVLVDDVYTTGRTIRLAADCLFDVGVETIKLRTIFR